MKNWFLFPFILILWLISVSAYSEPTYTCDKYCQYKKLKANTPPPAKTLFLFCVHRKGYNHIILQTNRYKKSTVNSLACESIKYQIISRTDELYPTEQHIKYITIEALIKYILPVLHHANLNKPVDITNIIPNCQKLIYPLVCTDFNDNNNLFTFWQTPLFLYSRIGIISDRDSLACREYHEKEMKRFQNIDYVCTTPQVNLNVLFKIDSNK